MDKPVGLEVGDLMVAHVGAVDNTETGGAIALPAGWTALVADLRESWGGTACVHQRAFYKVAVASDVAASNFAFTAADTPTFMSAAIYRINGQAWVDIIDDVNQDMDTTDGTPSLSVSVTPSQADNLLLMLITASSTGDPITGTSSQSISVSNPSWTEDYDVNNNPLIITGLHANRTETTNTGTVDFTVDGDVDPVPAAGVILVCINTAITTTVTAVAGELSLTGGTTAVNTGVKIIATAGNLVLTGGSSIITRALNWTNKVKNAVASFVGLTKNSASATNKSKTTSTWTNLDKSI